MPCGAGGLALASGLCLPHCASTRHCTFERKGLQYWQCSACREQTTVTCGTIFQAAIKNSVSALELKRHLSVRYKCAWLMKHKLLQVMAEREEGRQLDGRVEVDDAYLGGALPGGKRGRGS